MRRRRFVRPEPRFTTWGADFFPALLVVQLLVPVELLGVLEFVSSRLIRFSSICSDFAFGHVDLADNRYDFIPTDLPGGLYAIVANDKCHLAGAVVSGHGV